MERPDEQPMRIPPLRSTIVEYLFGCVLVVGLVAMLAGCSPRPPVASIPVAQACVHLAQISPEPAHITLTGDARRDASLLAATDLRLRAWGRELNALLVGCSG